MKKVFVGVTLVTLLVIGTLAYAHGPGGWGGGSMMGPGYGRHMMGNGYNDCGGQGACSGPAGIDEKFLDETADMRKELNKKRFEYSEAVRNPETDSKTIAKLEKEIRELQDTIHEKAPRTAYRGFGGYGCRW